MFKRLALAGLLMWGAGCTPSGAPTSEIRRELAIAHAPSDLFLGSAAGGSRPSAIGYGSLPDRGQLVEYPVQLQVRHEDAYTWHRADLSERHALTAIATGILTVTTPAGELLHFNYERHVEHPSGDWTWVGKLAGAAEGEEIILTFGEKAAFGTIAQPGKEPLRLTVRDGVPWLVETDRKALAAMDSPVTRPRRPDFLIPPKLAKRHSAIASGPSMEGAGASMVAATAAASNTLDLVLGYTSGFAASLGGQSQAVTRLNFLVAVTNEAYVNSQVDAQVRLVHALQVNYTDATSNSTALEEMTGFRAPSTKTTPAAAFAALRAARDQYGGDLVSLVRKFTMPENDGCGIAWLIGGGQTGIEASDEFFGYSVVSDGTDMGTDGKTYFCRDETLAHELGHNLGSQHDRSTATVDGTLNYGLYPYSFGYKSAAGAGNFYTVMAYGEKGQTRYRVFSNPRASYCGGYPCGVADEADNARSLALTLPLGVSFRNQVVPMSAGARDDLNGDGRSDLVWHSAAQGLMAYWWMTGATPSGTGVKSVGSAFRISGTGDFDGDGRGDILWSNTNNDLFLWRSRGDGEFDWQYVGSYAGNWSVASIADLNGDGKSDIVWQDSIQGAMAYWWLDGSVRIGSGVRAVGSIYRIVGTGDFDGDGFGDVLWANTVSNLLYIWRSRGDGGFDSQFVASYASGWSVSGVADLNGDGKSDIIWHEPNQGLMASWWMNGPAQIGTGIHPVGLIYRIAGTGDFDGDGRGDILWTNSANNLLYLWRSRGDGNFDPQFVASYSSDWSVVSGK